MDHWFDYILIIKYYNYADEQCKKTLDDASTWEQYWKNQKFGHLGIIGTYPNIDSKEQFNNRQNPKVHKAFASVLGTDELIVDIDRLGIMRPTKLKKWPRFRIMENNEMLGTSRL